MRRRTRNRVAAISVRPRQHATDDDANAAAFACLLELSRKREAVLARLDAPTRGRVEALVADALRADPPPTDEDRAAFDHFRRTGEVLGAAPPAAAEE